MSYHVLSRNLKISSEEFWRCLPCSISPFEFGCCDTIPLGTPYDILRWAMELVDWSVNGLAMTSSPMNYTQHIIFHPLISNTFHMAPQNRIISHLLASYLPSMAHPGKAGGLAPAADFSGFTSQWINWARRSKRRANSSCRAKSRTVGSSGRPLPAWADEWMMDGIKPA